MYGSPRDSLMSVIPTLYFSIKCSMASNRFRNFLSSEVTISLGSQVVEASTSEMTILAVFVDNILVVGRSIQLCNAVNAEPHRNGEQRHSQELPWPTSRHKSTARSVVSPGDLITGSEQEGVYGYLAVCRSLGLTRMSSFRRWEVVSCIITPSRPVTTLRYASLIIGIYSDISMWRSIKDLQSTTWRKPDLHTLWTWHQAQDADPKMTITNCLKNWQPLYIISCFFIARHHIRCFQIVKLQCHSNNHTIQGSPPRPNTPRRNSQLQYCIGDYTSRDIPIIDVLSCSDSNFAGDEDDRKSSTGYVFLICSGAVFLVCCSHKQSTVAFYSLESEYTALSERRFHKNSFSVNFAFPLASNRSLFCQIVNLHSRSLRIRLNIDRPNILTLDIMHLVTRFMIIRSMSTTFLGEIYQAMYSWRHMQLHIKGSIISLACTTAVLHLYKALWGGCLVSMLRCIARVSHNHMHQTLVSIKDFRTWLFLALNPGNIGQNSGIPAILYVQRVSTAPTRARSIYSHDPAHTHTHTHTSPADL